MIFKKIKKIIIESKTKSGSFQFAAILAGFLIYLIVAVLQS